MSNLSKSEKEDIEEYFRIYGTPSGGNTDSITNNSNVQGANLTEALNELYLRSVDGIGMFLNTDSRVYADEKQGDIDPNGNGGFYFKNEKAGEKINWYFYGLNAHRPHPYSDVNSFWMVVHLYKTNEIPFMNIYSAPTGTNDAGSWYHSRWDFTTTQTNLTPDRTYLIHTGEDPLVFESLDRIKLDAVGGVGEQSDGETILTMSIGSNSASPINTEEFTIQNIGFLTSIEHEYILNAVESIKPINLRGNSSETQIMSSGDEGSVISLNNIISLNGLTFLNNELEVLRSGVYSISIQLHLNSRSGVSTRLDTWIEVDNGAGFIPFPDSGRFIEFRERTEGMITYQSNISISKGTKFRLIGRSKTGSVELISSNLDNGTSAPSVVVSVIKL